MKHKKKRAKAPASARELNFKAKKRISRRGGSVKPKDRRKRKTSVRPASDSQLRVAKITPPGEHVTFDEWRDTIIKNFPSLINPAEVCLGVVAQLLLNDVTNPFALALVDVPSSGKTITLNFFDEQNLVYTTDNFTAASLVSHASNVSPQKLAKVDLLPRIRFKTLVVRDLAPIFGAKHDDLVKSLAILTRVLDGEGLETDSGVHGQRGYKGDYLFMMLAGTTPISQRVFKTMGNLGSRFFFLRVDSPDKDDGELAAQNQSGDWKAKEKLCRAATRNFLRGLWTANPAGVQWNKAGDPQECMLAIAASARLLACLRGNLNDEYDLDGSPGEPVIEKPDRINCLLYNLARGHALVCGRRQISMDDLAPVVNVTLDSAPNNRAKLIRALLASHGSLNTSAVETYVSCSKPTALRLMKNLASLGVVKLTSEEPACGRPESEIRLAPDFVWFGSAECKSLLR